MADQNIVTNITATANFSGLTAQLQAVTSQLLKLQATTIGLNKNLTSQVGVMNRQFDETMRSTGQFARHFVTLTSDVSKFGQNLDSGRMKLGEYFRTWQGHTRKTSTLVKELAKQQVMLENAIIQPLGKNAQGLMQYNVMVQSGLDATKNKSALLRQELSIMNKVMNDGANQLINWGKNTQWAGRQLTVGLTVPLAAFGMAAAKAFRQADQELVRLTKVYGGLTATSTADLLQVRKDVSALSKELASGLGQNVNDTIALAADIAATGKQGNDLLNSTRETTRLAVLGEVDRQDAMKATLSIQTAFGQNTKQLAESIDFLNAVENQTSTSLQDLVDAIPKAGPVVKALGGDIKDLALYITAMKEGGINASEGANALKSALASIINPTKVAKEMFAGLGIDLGGIVTKNAGNLTGTIMALKDSLDTLDPLNRAKAIEQLFGKFQFARVNALFENLGKQGSQTLQVLDLMKASTTDLANISARELKTMTESASGKYKRALESVKADLVTIGEEFLKVGTFVLNAIDGIVKFIGHLPAPIKAVLGFLGGLTAIAGPIIMLTGVLANFFGYIVKGIFALKNIGKGGTGFKLLTPELMAAAEAGKNVEQSFYSDTKAAATFSDAVLTLAASFEKLKQSAMSSTIATNNSMSTVAGNPVMRGGGRIVDKDNPLVGRPYSRDMSHVIPTGSKTPEQRANETIFSTVPGPKPVNLRLSNSPQTYMNEDLARIHGVTSINGVSNGIVATEAAKWHSMTAALAMQSEAEIKLLKTEVAATGTVTASLADSYQALLPQMTKITTLAADETALIVSQLQAGKITVEAARAKIFALNAEVEAMMAQTAAGVASAQARNISLTTVPLTSQPVVSAAGKSNMKELFHKSETSKLVDSIARSLGVRTSGAGYSIQTTKPRFNSGGKIEEFNASKTRVTGPSSISYDDRMGSVPLGGYVLNQSASMDPANAPLVEAAASTYNNTSSGKISALLTPQETVFGPGIKDNPELYRAVEAANNGTSLPRHAAGGRVKLSRNGYGLKAPKVTKQSPLQRTHITDDLSGLMLLLPRELNLGVNSNGNGLTGKQIASLIRQTLASGINPNSLMNEAAATLGGDALQAELRNSAALTRLINTMESPSNIDRMIGGRLDPFGFERIAKEIYVPALRGIRVDSAQTGGTRNLYSAISQIYTTRAQEVMTRDEAISRGLISGDPNGSKQRGQIIRRSSGRLTWVSENRTLGSRMPNWARGTKLATLLTTSNGVSNALKLIKRNSGGEIGGSINFGKYNYGKMFLGMPRGIKAVEQQRKARLTMEEISAGLKTSRFAEMPPTDFGKLISPSSGRSFPVSGIGGLYEKPDGTRVFVKPVMDETAALAEQRATIIAREAHGLNSPRQEIRTMIDPTDPTGRRKLIVLESPYDEAFAKKSGIFAEKDYFKQLVAANLRGDKDLSADNLYGRTLADVGTAGVFKMASGKRAYEPNMISMSDQARINLLGVKGGAKKFFAEATLNIPKGMTPKQYHEAMIAEIDTVLPALKKTISEFNLNTEETAVYAAMIKRLEDGRKVNWEEFHGIHSAVKPSAAKALTPAALKKLKEEAELRIRQRGHAVSLADNSFKTPLNGFNGGGAIGNVLKGLAMRRIGAGFGPTGAPKPSVYESAPWGVNSLSIEMANTLFASSGLRKHTQKLLYDKFAAALAKEKPYGYVKDASGSLKNALEPAALDAVIRQAASDLIGDRNILRQLSPIDKNILRTKYLNWDSKKDTPITAELKKKIFGIDGKREMGGPVSPGQNYLVGEKGPEIFSPSQSGKIVPGYEVGGLIHRGKQAYGISGNPAKRAEQEAARAARAAAYVPPPVAQPQYKPGPLSGSRTTVVGNGGVRTNVYGLQGSLPYAPGLTMWNGPINAAINAMKTAALKLRSGLTNLGTVIKYSSQQALIGVKLAGSNMVAGLKYLATETKKVGTVLANSAKIAGRYITNAVKTTGAYLKGWTASPAAVRPGAYAGATLSQNFAANARQTTSNMFHPIQYLRNKGVGPAITRMDAHGNYTFGSGGVGGTAGMLGGMAAGTAIGGKFGGAQGAMMGSMVGMMAGQSIIGSAGKSIAKKVAEKQATKAAAAAAAGLAVEGTSSAAALGATAAAAAGTIAPILALTAVVYGGYKAWKHYKEGQDLNVSTFGMTAEAAKKSGLRFTDFSLKIKETIHDAQALRKANEMVYQSMKDGGTPFQMTISEYKKLKVEVKETFAEQIKALDRQPSNKVPDAVRRIKEQLIASGMSAEEATKKIYTMLQLSNKKDQSITATMGNNKFKKITDAQTAAVGAVSDFGKSTKNEGSRERAAALNTALMATENGINDLIAKREKLVAKDTSGKIKSLSYTEAEKIMMDRLNNSKEAGTIITEETVAEMAKTNPAVKKMINGQDTMISVWKKIRLEAMGYGGDLSKLSAEQANVLEKSFTAISTTVESKNRDGLLKAQYSNLDKLKAQITSYTKALKGQSVAAQISDRDRIAALNKQIEANNKLADARKKALTQAQADADLGRQIEKTRLEMQNASAVGDTAQAQTLRIDLESLTSQQQTEAQTRAIDKATEDANKTLKNAVDAISNKQQKLSDSAALAGESLDKIKIKYDKQKEAIDKVNGAMTALYGNAAAAGKTIEEYIKTVKGGKEAAGLVASEEAATGKKMPTYTVGKDGKKVPISPEQNALAILAKAGTGSAVNEALAASIKGGATLQDVVNAIKGYTPDSKNGNTTFGNDPKTGTGKDAYSAYKDVLSKGQSQKLSTATGGSFEVFQWNKKYYAADATTGVIYPYDVDTKKVGTKAVKKAATGVIGGKGMFLVGEKGPELVHLKSAANIMPNDVMNTLAAASPRYNFNRNSYNVRGDNAVGASYVVNQNIYASEGMDVEALSNMIVKKAELVIGQKAKVNVKMVGQGKNI